MSIGEPRKGTSMNTDTVYLMALNDQLTQTMIWATAARATVQVMLAKRAPEPAPEPVPVVAAPPVAAPLFVPPTAPASPAVAQFSAAPYPPAPGKRSKGTLVLEAGIYGIPQSVVLGASYLNHPNRPTDAGLTNTVNLISAVKALREKGEDPSHLWTVPNA